MREKRGLPIAAHLALLVALAFAAAYVVNLAIVLALPPRPPDVVRGDLIVEMFENGYRAASKDARAPRDEGVRWTIVRKRPRFEGGFPVSRHLALLLAERMAVSPSKILVAGDAAPADVFVFRVQNRARHADVHRFERRIARAHERIEALHPHVRQWTGPIEPPVAPTPPTPPEPPDPPAPPEPPEPLFFAPAAHGVVLLSGFRVAAELPDGRWLVMRQARNLDSSVRSWHTANS